MRHRRPAPIRPDILHLGQDKLGTADQVTVFGSLFDAAIRSTHTMLPDDPRSTAILNDAMGRVREELKRETPVQIARAPALGRGITVAAAQIGTCASPLSRRWATIISALR